MRRKILIDTDPGIDDAMAILMALGASSLEVIGLTTVYGNHEVGVWGCGVARECDGAGGGEHSP
jgi:uridine nucleosidase